MFKKTLLAAGMAALFLGSNAVSADVVSVNIQDISISGATYPQTDWFATFNVPKFDTMGGTRILDSAAINLSGSWSETLSFTNNTVAPGAYSVSLSGEIGIGASTNVLNSFTNDWWMYTAGVDNRGNNNIVQGNASATFDHAQSSLVTAVAGVSATGVTGSPTAPATPFNTTALGSLYTSLQANGGGLFPMTAYGVTRFQLGGNNITNTSSSGTAYADVVVNYTYHNAPASVPEPAALALLAMGAAGIAASRRRKMTTVA